MVIGKDDSKVVKRKKSVGDTSVSKVSKRSSGDLKQGKSAGHTAVKNDKRVKESPAVEALHVSNVTSGSLAVKSKVKKVLKGSGIAKVHSSSVYATGRRKVALAKVWLWNSEGGEISHSVNGIAGLSYFASSPTYIHTATKPFGAVGADINQYSFRADVCGGGKSGQSDALRHAFARAIIKLIPSVSGLLRDAKMLTRDSRMVQSKNTGKKKARKSEQYSKR